jgi:imidazoleglycerol phosphate synthase cyclase subunit
VRVVARLDVKDENLVKGIQLEGLRKLGPPNAFARKYYAEGIDELLYIDIVASLYNRNNLSEIVKKTCEEVFIPVTVGGGLRSVEDVRHILSMGADKAAINTAAIKRPGLITEVAEAFGSQCMVLSVQAKRSRTQSGKWEAYFDNGREHSGYDVIEWVKRAEELGAGEIRLRTRFTRLGRIAHAFNSHVDHIRHLPGSAGRDIDIITNLTLLCHSETACQYQHQKKEQHDLSHTISPFNPKSDLLAPYSPHRFGSYTVPSNRFFSPIGFL